MPINWVGLLRNVPWTEVVKGVPKVVDGARKLWSAVRKQPAIDGSAPAPPQSEELDRDQRVAAIEARATTLEAAVMDLQEEMVKSAELIKSLAEQNQQLVKQLETIRVRIMWLGSGIIVFAIIAVASLFISIF